MTAVLGFIAQCSICPQQAIVASQDPWLCPRCEEVADPAPSDVRYAVQLDDGTVHTVSLGELQQSHPDPVARGLRSIRGVWASAQALLGPGGFGDIDVAQGEPIHDDTELPYKPPPWVKREVEDFADDEPDLGSIRG